LATPVLIVCRPGQPPDRNYPFYQYRPVPISEETQTLVAELNAFGNKALVVPSDFALLLELARLSGKVNEFDRLAFLAKFATRVRGIMKRIGPDGEGYETLSREFVTALDEIVGILGQLMQAASPEERNGFESRYLSKSMVGLEGLLLLLSDLTRYKNWRIDHPGRKG
jgi:hypothetical protein